MGWTVTDVKRLENEAIPECVERHLKDYLDMDHVGLLGKLTRADDGEHSLTTRAYCRWHSIKLGGGEFGVVTLINVDVTATSCRIAVKAIQEMEMPYHVPGIEFIEHLDMVGMPKTWHVEDARRARSWRDEMSRLAKK